MNRREFLGDVKWTILRWSPWLGLLGLQLHRYGAATAAKCGYAGWVTFCGRVVGFVPR